MGTVHRFKRHRPRRTWHGAHRQFASGGGGGRSVSFAELRVVVLLGCLIGLSLNLYDGGSAVIDSRDCAPAFDSASPDRQSANFSLCHSGGGTNCVVDGDTFYLGGEKIRIADIDTPETHPPRCAEEAERGERATLRLRALLNAGPFALEAIDRDEDVYGRKLRTVTRDGRSLGDVLVSEGLARRYGNGRRSWCA